MSAEDDIKEVIELLDELKEDSTVPRNVRTKIEATIASLSEQTEVSIRVSRALHEMEELSEDTNMQPYTRTQIWNIVSLLEKIA